jgi:predicted nuclease of restriction endonuclease-like (RecB) superfamily
MGDKRKSMGKERKGVMIPVPPSLSEMDAAYFDLRNAIVERVKTTRLNFVIQANQGMIELYWNIGNDILKKQEAEGWGARVIDRLSADLREEFPDMEGFSVRNLGNMKRFAKTWSSPEILQQPVAKIQWRSILTLLSKIEDNETREMYAARALEHGWSSNVLHHMIDMRYIEREGRAVTNFPTAIPPQESDMAVQVFKDPHIFDFVGTAAARRGVTLWNTLWRAIKIRSGLPIGKMNLP